MKIRHFLISAAIAVSLCGCGLWPKNVEFGQDKVKKFPVAAPKEKEVQKQVAQRAEETARETLDAAVKEESSPAVIVPATETVVLTDVLSESLGPPMKPAPKDTESSALAQELRTSIAKLDKRLDDFKVTNDENVGKKIEGTGWLSVPYFLWVAIMLFVGFVIWIILKSLLSVAAAGSPPVAVGLKVAQVGGKVLSRAFGQVIKGGEEFKNRVKAEVKDADLQARILELFRSSQMQHQDQDVQQAIQKLKE